ncbi:hypothetical protein ACJ72_08725 [Emergomyces africanus]|uniref:cAMP-dependent protein kinase n=1 Tax=Emergomyces africanus TaxID=1955775 RepID=A0A1B7NJF0_9EURO|nr:hypothetical protein ACJ72_08725 [Emergomyces africanus]
MAAEMLHEQHHHQQQGRPPKLETRHHHPDIDIDIEVPATQNSPQHSNTNLGPPKSKTALDHLHPGPPASRPRTPQDIVENREKGRLNIPSSQLSLGDFELLKTLGTGTFARVWLVCLRKYAANKNKAYALKILQKADVIKLKQVEHVRNEIKTLAAVAGHPFITTLVATFTDDLCLYMLANMNVVEKFEN